MTGPAPKRLPPAALEALSSLDERQRREAAALLEWLEPPEDAAAEAAAELARVVRSGGGEAFQAVVDGARRLGGLDRELGLHWARLGPRLAEAYPAARLRGLAETCASVARQSWPVAVRCAEALPSVAHLPAEQLQAWARLGARLAARNPQVARRYFAHSPRVFSANQPWTGRVLGLGLRVVDRNVYQALPLVLLGTLACASTPPAVHGRLLQLAERLAETSLEAARRLLRAAPAVLRRWTAAGLEPWARAAERLRGHPRLLEALMAASPGLAGVVGPDQLPALVDLGLRVAERHEAVAAVFLERSPLPLATVEPRQLGGWVNAGVEMALVPLTAGDLREWARAYRGEADAMAGLGISGRTSADPVAQRAAAFFGLETAQSRLLLLEMSAGLRLEQVRAPLSHFLRAMTGVQVDVAASEGGPRDRVGFSDPLRLELPAQVAECPTRLENYARYLLAAAHHGARIEFGGFRWLGIPAAPGEPPRKQPHQQPQWLGPVDFPPRDSLFADLFNLAEGFRVECRLRADYPGLVPGLDRQARRACSLRPKPSVLPPATAVVEALLRRAALGERAGPPPRRVAVEVERCWGLFSPLEGAGATVDDSWEAAKAARAVLLPLLGTLPYGGVEPLPHHGMWTFRSEDEGEAAPAHEGAGDEVPAALSEDELRELLEVLRAQGEDVSPFEPPRPTVEVEGLDGAAVTEMVMVRTDAPEQGTGEDGDGGRMRYYPEWDRDLADYRPNWVTLRERPIPSAADDSLYRGVLAQYRGVLAAVRRSFSRMVPQTWVKLRRQPEGDDVDVDAAVEAGCDAAAGASPSERIYTKREKRERSLAAAILVDMSGSTKESIGAKTVMEIETEGLVVLSEALHALGDRFAIYGFSGDTRHQVDFYVVKDFEERYGRAIHARIGGMRSMVENRDGCAIRHATARLEAVQAKTKLLLMLGDGKPVDKGYSADYSIADTRMALQEARAKGIHPFCITVDKQGKSYLEEMYGPNDFLIIDHTEQLPRRLPAIYRRLAV